MGNVEKDRQAEVNKVETEKLVAESQPTMQEEPSNILPNKSEPVLNDNRNKAKEDNTEVKRKSFNLPIPEHANDFMKVIEAGGFSLDDEEDEITKVEELSDSKNKVLSISKEETDGQKLLEEWSKIKNLVMFTEKKLKLTKGDSNVSCENEIKCITENFHALQKSIDKSDSVQTQKIIITIIEKITIIIEIIEYRITNIHKIKNPSEREKICNILKNELIYITEHLTLLKEYATAPNVLTHQLVTLINESINKIKNHVVNVEKIVETE